MLLMVFVALSVPTLVFVIVCAYLESCRAAQQVLTYDVTRGQQAINRSIHIFFSESVKAVQGLAALAERDSSFFRNPAGGLALRGQFMGMHHLNSLSVTYEDGFSVGTTSVDNGWRTRNPQTPESAALLDFKITPGPLGSQLDIRQGFVDKTGQVIQEVSGPLSFDPRDLPNYVLARGSEQVVISDPTTHPGSGERVIAVAAPVHKGDIFLGAVSASAAITDLAQFLYLNRVTPETLIAIVDDQEKVVVPPLFSASDGPTTIDENIEDALMRVEARISEAMKLVDDNSSSVTIESAVIGGRQYTLSLTPIKNQFNLPWRLLIATPESDYIGPLQRASTFLAWLLVVIIPIQLLLIRTLSLRISRGIVGMANRLRQIRLMNFEAPSPGAHPFTKEVADLSDGISLLQSALRSFAQYIPLGVVRELIAKEKPLELGVEERKLAIMFTDLENFSTVSQSVSPNELLTQLSDIFSVMTGAVTEEQGTVDKFIGDSVMAFWGAPSEISDSPLRACKAALRITRRIEKLNLRWREEGKATLRVRVGINYASVLVGNIGTSERLSYTAIGDGVNVASRLEGTNKQFNTSICVSDYVYNEVSSYVIARPLGEVSVKGRVGTFPVYEILGIRDSSDPDLAPQDSIAR